MSIALQLVIACGLLAVVYGAFTSRAILAANAGNQRMTEIAAAASGTPQSRMARRVNAATDSALDVGETSILARRE